MSGKVNIPETIGNIASMFTRFYSIEELAAFTDGLHNRSGRNPFASNPGVQILQSKWKTQGKVAPISRPRNQLAGLWGELTGDRRSEMSAKQREHILKDILVSRALVPSVSLMGMYILGELPAALAKRAYAA